MKMNKQHEDKRNSRTRQLPWKNFIVSSTEASEQRRIASGWKPRGVREAFRKKLASRKP
jgi:hypothetical protein